MQGLTANKLRGIVQVHIHLHTCTLMPTPPGAPHPHHAHAAPSRGAVCRGVDADVFGRGHHGRPRGCSNSWPWPWPCGGRLVGRRRPDGPSGTLCVPFHSCSHRTYRLPLHSYCTSPRPHQWPTMLQVCVRSSFSFTMLTRPADRTHAPFPCRHQALHALHNPASADTLLPNR